MSEYFYIYRIYNKKNRLNYTERAPMSRWWEHLRHSSLPIGKALQTEGIENFTFEVITKQLKSEYKMEERHVIETYYMQKYESIENGYNRVPSYKM